MKTVILEKLTTFLLASVFYVWNKVKSQAVLNRKTTLIELIKQNKLSYNEMEK